MSNRTTGRSTAPVGLVVMGSLSLAAALIVVLTECGVPVDQNIPSAADVFSKPVAAAVDWAEGATIETAAGNASGQMRLLIPPGALVEDASVRISQVGTLPADVTDDEALVGAIFNIEGLQGKIDGNITMVLPYHPARIPGSYDSNDVFAAFWDGGRWSVVGRTAVDPETFSVTVETYHASMWVARAEHPYEIQPVAGADQVVTAGDLVRLDASDSSLLRKGLDVTLPEKLIFRWRQMTGTPVSLDDPDSATPTFTAPAVVYDMNLRFELAVICGYSSNHFETASVVVTVTPRPAPDQASDPTPAQGATDVSLNVVLKWTPAEENATHELYLGTDIDEVREATHAASSYLGSLTAARYTPSAPFATSTTYYWRVDEVTSAGTTEGVVWQFTTLPPIPGAASNPFPADGAGQVAVDTFLSWTPGSHATSHDVYLGTNQDLVAQATTADTPVYQGRQASKAFVPSGDLYNGTTYYWRIDEITNAGVTKGTVYRFTTIEAPADQASNPTPADQAANVPTTASLSWQTGSSLATHDVYFGTDSAAVTYATTADAAFKGNQTGATYQIGGGLQAGQAYYWRIDEVTEAGVTRGEVWSFSTVPPYPGAASNPVPADAATDVSTTPTLSWTAGGDAISHDIYLGTDSQVVAGAEVGDTPIYRGRQTSKYYTPSDGESTLLPKTTYYWRVDEVNEAGVTTGTVWQFTTAPGPPDPASQPNPGSDQTNVAVTVVLSWTAGADATAHRVYLGTDESAVSAATTDSVLYKGEQSGTTYDPPGDLNPTTTYYWRIDEVNSSGVTTGSVWNFTTN